MREMMMRLGVLSVLNVADTMCLISKQWCNILTVVIVPELFGDEENWDLYYKLVEEMRALQKENVRGISWYFLHCIARNLMHVLHVFLRATARNRANGYLGTRAPTS